MEGVPAAGAPFLESGWISAMDISVVIPTHNRAGPVKRALASVFRQTLAPRDVIVVDDGSGDDTVESVRSDFPDAVIVSQAQRGVSAARNAGVAVARSNWIAFLDSDDEWLPDKLERQANALKLEPGHLACHSDEIWIRDGVRVNPMRKHRKYGGWIYPHCLPLCCVSPSSILLHRDALAAAGMFDESLPACEDYDLWLRLFSRIPVVLVAERLLIKYGGHQDQLSRQYWGMDRFRVRALVKILESGSLNNDWARLTLETLHEKLDILIAGMAKHGRVEMLEHYRSIRTRWVPETC